VRLLGGEQFSLSDMIVFLCYDDNEHAPRPEGRDTIVGFQRVTVIAIL
jgi:hypothetical protein